MWLRACGDTLTRSASWGPYMSPRASHLRPSPRETVTPGITAPPLARGDLIIVKPEVCPTPYRARATVDTTLARLLEELRYY